VDFVDISTKAKLFHTTVNLINTEIRHPNMTDCNANRCHISCSPGQGCGCIYIYPMQASPEGQCICECYDSEDKTGKVVVTIGDVVKSIPIRKYKPGFKTSARTKMDICTSNFPAAALAEILDRILLIKYLFRQSMQMSELN
jgi:hypothetical protein